MKLPSKSRTTLLIILYCLFIPFATATDQARLKETFSTLRNLNTTTLTIPNNPSTNIQNIRGSFPLKSSTLRGLAAQSGILISIPEQDRILSGDKAQPHEFPWQIAILNRRFGTLVCGGTHLGNGWILTAAHCLDDGTKAEDLAVLYGTLSLINGGTRVPVKSIQYHDSWNPDTHRNDIGLVRIDSPDNLPAAKLASLAIEAPLIQVGTQVLVSGWGTTTPNGNISLDLLRVAIPIISKSECNTAYNNIIGDDQICAGETDKDSCQGDSGGPLTGVENGNKIILGIVSFGRSCGEKRFPGIYTRITVFHEWIKNKTGIDIANNYNVLGCSESETECMQIAISSTKFGSDLIDHSRLIHD